MSIDLSSAWDKLSSPTRGRIAYSYHHGRSKPGTKTRHQDDRKSLQSHLTYANALTTISILSIFSLIFLFYSIGRYRDPGQSFGVVLVTAIHTLDLVISLLIVFILSGLIDRRRLHALRATSNFSAADYQGNNLAQGGLLFFVPALYSTSQLWVFWTLVLLFLLSMALWPTFLLGNKQSQRTAERSTQRSSTEPEEEEVLRSIAPYIFAATTWVFLVIAFYLDRNPLLVWWPNLVILAALCTAWVLRRCIPGSFKAKGTGLVFHTWRLASAALFAVLIVAWVHATLGMTPKVFFKNIGTLHWVFEDAMMLWTGAILFQMIGFDGITLGIPHKSKNTGRG